MKYFIGLQIPKKNKLRIEMLRAEFKFFTTEPHITLISPALLPNDDSFINKIVEVCKQTQQFYVTFSKLKQFDNKVLYMDVHSPQLVTLHEEILKKLNIVENKKNSISHLTIVKQGQRREINIPEIKKRAEKIILPTTNFSLNSIVIYKQPKEKSIYLPYMKIPFEG
jgi:2'-5' RNA ligase